MRAAGVVRVCAGLAAATFLSSVAALPLVGHGRPAGAGPETGSAGRTSGGRAAARAVAQAATTAAPTTTVPPLDPRLLVEVQGPQPGDRPQVVMVRPDGSDPRVLARAPVRTDQVSPDGTRVVYPVDQGSGSYSGCGFAGCSTTYTSASGIAVANYDGSGQQVLTSGGYDRDPRWSPDGDVIAYTSHVKDPAGTEADVIRLMDPTGHDLAVVPAPPGSLDGYPEFSPDGGRLAFIRLHAGQTTLEVADMAGLTVTAVAQGGFSGPLAWSPDGTRIVLAAKSSPSAVEPDQLEMVTVAGGSVRTVYASPPPFPERMMKYLCGETVNEWPVAVSPAWSPDGTSIAFMGNANHRGDDNSLTDVLSVGPDGSGVRTVRATPPPQCQQHVTGRLEETVTLLGWVPRP